jgi:hypothetical protein
MPIVHTNGIGELRVRAELAISSIRSGHCPARLRSIPGREMILSGTERAQTER